MTGELTLHLSYEWKRTILRGNKPAQENAGAGQGSIAALSEPEQRGTAHILNALSFG